MTLSGGNLRGNKLPPYTVFISANPTTGGHMTFNNGLDKQVVYIGSGKSNTGLVTVLDVNGTGGRVLSGRR